MARALIGVTLVFGDCAGVIVETEAYRDDPASHWVTRPVAGKIMETTHGHVYVYRIYGVHHCLNFTTERTGVGAVLLRALEPLDGLDAMRRRRGVASLRALCSGPAKLVEALGVGPELTGRPVAEAFTLMSRSRRVSVGAGPRIGISRATDLPWRFFERGSAFLSRPEGS